MENRLKIGDKVCCKKNVYYNDIIHFYKCDYYKITYTNNLWVEITSFYKKSWNFSISPFSSASHQSDFEDYFYTLKETRKLKLDLL